MKGIRNTRKLSRFGAAAIALVMAAAFAVTDVSAALGAEQAPAAKAPAAANTIKQGTNTVKITGCIKGKEYVISVVKGSYKSYTVSDDTLLYIDQKTAEGSEVEFTFPIEGSQRVVLLVSSNDGAADYPIMLGEANIPVSEAAATVAARTYNGKAQGTSATLKYRGSALKNGTDFILSGTGKNVGTYTVRITGKGRFTGTVTKKFNINPVGTKLSSVKKGKKSMTVKWKKPAKKYKAQMTGYQIQYSLYSNFRSAKTVSGGKYAKTSKVIKGLKAKKKYYVRIRTYKGKCYSAWSSVKSVKTK